MKLNRERDFKRYNILAWETDSLYHKISLRFGLTDSAVNILYLLCYQDNSAMLSDIVRCSGLQKQTINSSLRILEDKGLVTMDKVNGKMKSVTLTDKGSELCSRTVAHLIEWENRALSLFSDDELKLFLTLMERYLISMKESLASFPPDIPPEK